MVVLPPLAMAGWTLLLAVRRPAWGWRRSFLRAGVLTAAFAILGTEALSLLGAVDRVGLALGWGFVLAAQAAWFAVRARRSQPVRLPPIRLPASWVDRGLTLAALSIVAAIGLIAFRAPPNTWDSLNYHMARVAHWAQEGSIRHYATGTEVQNGQSPGAEILVLQAYVLDHGDQWVNFVDWLAMLICVAGGSLVAKDLGAKPVGQGLASLLVLTLPMGIAQASSTMTDYVVAAWMMCVAAETIRLARDGPGNSNIAYLGASAGLALSAKPTAFVYLLPFAVLCAVWLLRRREPRGLVRSVLIVAGAVLLLNAGHWTRNLGTYGNPLGDQVGVHSNEIHTPAALLSSLLRHAGLEAGTPWEALNRQLLRGVLKAHLLLGLDVNDPRTTAIGEFGITLPSREETRAPNWFHAWLYAGAFLLLLACGRRFDRLTWGLALATVSTFVLFSLVFKWQVFSARYHLPFFVLFAPVAAVVFGDRAPSWLLRLIGALFLVLSSGWVLRLENRPLLPQPGTGVSVLNTPREQLYFWPGSMGVTDEVAHAILEQGCSTVGMVLTGNAAEYPFWVYLGAPRSDLRIDWIVSGTPSARYEDPTFEPCAVICDASCPQDWTTIRGLSRLEAMGGYRLFLR